MFDYWLQTVTSSCPKTEQPVAPVPGDWKEGAVSTSHSQLRQLLKNKVMSNQHRCDASQQGALLAATLAQGYARLRCLSMREQEAPQGGTRCT